MSFTSWQFPFFLTGFVLLYWRLRHRPRLWLLLTGSYIFYAFWDVRFLALVFTTTVVNYLGALGLAGETSRPKALLPLVLTPFGWLLICFFIFPGSGLDISLLLTVLAATLIFLATYIGIRRLRLQRRRQGFLLLSIGSCLIILGYFKYCNFFIHSAASILGFLGLKADWPTLNIILPVGISFYTFQSLGYVIDVYRGQGEVCRNLLTFAVYNAFFPQMVAGPIERGRQLLPQLETDQEFKTVDLHEGLVLILVGLFKKVFLADNCALLANYVFDQGTVLNASWALIGGLAFTFQIYGDFSGYTDMARGTAKTLGINLVQNFHFPYLARNPSDFWSRWHISLSSWFRDYVYIPLGGNRGSHWQTVRNLMATMLLAGLWHGADWVFVIWGAYHGILLVLYRYGPLSGLNRKNYEPGWRYGLALPVMFSFTLVGWAIFRSPSLEHFGMWFTALGDWGPAALPWQASAWWLVIHLAPLILLQVLTARFADETKFMRLPWMVRGTIYSILFLLIVSSTAQDQEFIYFQF